MNRAFHAGISPACCGNSLSDRVNSVNNRAPLCGADATRQVCASMFLLKLTPPMAQRFGDQEGFRSFGARGRSMRNRQRERTAKIFLADDALPTGAGNDGQHLGNDASTARATGTARGSQT
jgi:hypothetical protein